MHPETNSVEDQSRPRTSRRRRTLLIVVVGVVAVGSFGGLALGLLGGHQSEAGQRPTLHEVAREDLLVSVDQPGTIESRNKEIIRSQVRRELEITEMVEEGTIVEEGDLLVKLDSTPIEEELTEDEQQLDNARSQLIAAEVTLENTTSQAQSNIEQAELDYRFAQLDLEKYLNGEYPQQLAQAQAAVQVAEEDKARADETVAASRELYEAGYITENELKGDEAAAIKAQLDLEIARGELRVLQQYTHKQQKEQLEANVRQAEAELERVKNKAKADVERAKAELNNAQAQLTRRERDVKEERENLANCEIRAPIAGRVVYAPQGNRWRQEEPLAEGSTVRFNQEIIHLPETGAMSVDIKIQEAQRDKVEVGMPVRITLPSMPAMELSGKLVDIAEYLDPSGWWNNNQKVYSARIDIDGTVSELRTGMNCQTQIIVGSFEDVLTVPLQSVVRVGEQHMVYAPGPNGEPQPRPVTIGLDNGRKVHIKSGLAEGDLVLLTPPLEPASRRDEAQPEPSDADGDRAERGGDDGDGAAGADDPGPDASNR
jgi:HlyD family secretion protein